MGQQCGCESSTTDVTAPEASRRSQAYQDSHVGPCSEVRRSQPALMLDELLEDPYGRELFTRFLVRSCGLLRPAQHQTNPRRGQVKEWAVENLGKGWALQLLARRWPSSRVRASNRVYT